MSWLRSRPLSQQLDAIQAAARKLAARFPLHDVPLKKCVSTGEAS